MAFSMSSLPIMKRIRLMTIGSAFGKAISSLTTICLVHLKIQLKTQRFEKKCSTFNDLVLAHVQGQRKNYYTVACQGDKLSDPYFMKENNF